MIGIGRRFAALAVSIAVCGAAAMPLPAVQNPSRRALPPRRVGGVRHPRPRGARRGRAGEAARGAAAAATNNNLGVAELRELLQVANPEISQFLTPA